MPGGALSGEIHSPSDHEFVNKPRRNREYLRSLLSYAEPDLQGAVDQYVAWAQYDENLILRKDTREKAGVSFKGVLMSKRGNRVYEKRVKKRVDQLESIENIVWFNHLDRSKAAKTGGLFVTLTYRRARRVDETWELIGEDFNRFISALRRRYGEVNAFRTWEAHKDGYPHIHVILLFKSKSFDCFFNRGATETWRIQGKSSLEPLWPHGFIDVEALASSRGGIRYVAKYLGKIHRALEGPPPAYDKNVRANPTGLTGLVSGASVLTMALCWAMARRSFSISRRLVDLTTPLRNSNGEVSELTGQLDLAGERVSWWVLVGFWGGDLGSWSRDLSLKEYRDMRSSVSWSDNSRLGGKKLGVVSGWDV